MLSVCDFATNIIEWGRFDGVHRFLFQRVNRTRTFLSFMRDNGVDIFLFAFVADVWHSGETSLLAHTFSMSTCRLTGSTSPIHTSTFRYITSRLRDALRFFCKISARCKNCSGKEVVDLVDSISLLQLFDTITLFCDKF